MLRGNNRQKGFTLIELILVIVLLGIMAAVAIPQFVDLKSDAVAARRDGTLAGLKGTVVLLHAQYLLDNTLTYNATSVVNGTDISGGTPSNSATNITVTWDDATVDTFAYTDQAGFNAGAVN
ncbi:MAG: prepilin-type N-terminal cleavage/methylation domain-containing protein [Nitrospinaceae bacterium]|nr:prepilin-type N-terminal cleavage/methylation domain-containing protein [Nitrospinaceae bacterium]NIT80877.1 prepilin-type N-terminal cleavage/methylation domain-containing protein [Nitrospinaceae bacterium]NIX33291.1 prepilin-type N-terminal cleavage/methylation domain-containing protein [Nitrospinaceae bacterium]NIY13918.1 prepilin-type N-terminal cleavage/methylation domain-containing protein [Nitrospinaceae bacterium]